MKKKLLVQQESSSEDDSSWVAIGQVEYLKGSWYPFAKILHLFIAPRNKGLQVSVAQVHTVHKAFAVPLL